MLTFVLQIFIKIKKKCAGTANYYSTNFDNKDDTLKRKVCEDLGS